MKPKQGKLESPIPKPTLDSDDAEEDGGGCVDEEEYELSVGEEI
jgi:hypothetical protein